VPAGRPAGPSQRAGSPGFERQRGSRDRSLVESRCLKLDVGTALVRSRRSGQLRGASSSGVGRGRVSNDSKPYIVRPLAPFHQSRQALELLRGQRGRLEPTPGRPIHHERALACTGPLCVVHTTGCSHRPFCTLRHTPAVPLCQSHSRLTPAASRGGPQSARMGQESRKRKHSDADREDRSRSHRGSSADRSKHREDPKRSKHGGHVRRAAYFGPSCCRLARRASAWAVWDH
jgi:hypothetical protein